MERDKFPLAGREQKNCVSREGKKKKKEEKKN